MAEKSMWMILFVAVFILCALMTIFLILNSGAMDDKTKYETLKKDYADLAEKHAKMLEAAIIINTDIPPAPPANTDDKGKEKTAAQKLADENAELKETVEGLKTQASDLVSDYENENAMRNEIVRLRMRAVELKLKL